MSRFKTSKYKNAYSYVYKQEYWVNDCNVSAHLSSKGNLIDASREFVAFCQDSNGVNVLPLSSRGRFTKFPVISEPTADLAFSPFHDRLLVTGGVGLKLWEIPTPLPLDSLLSLPLLSLPCQSSVEMVRFHPAADNVVMGCAGRSVTIWDLESQTDMMALDQHGDPVQCVCWHGNGSLVASVCKKERQKSIKLFDPRASPSPVQEAFAHSAQKNSQVLWLGDSPYFLSAGTDLSRNAELALWDVARLDKPLFRTPLGTSSSGNTMMFYDEDTNMVYVALKNESTIMFYELMESGPSLSLGNHVYRGSQQAKGLTLLPKSTVDVMSCQIARLLQLTQRAVVPISYHVQRKGQSEFHSDLFPDTRGPVSSMTPDQWRQGANTPVLKVSMDPAQSRMSSQKDKQKVEPTQSKETAKPVTVKATLPEAPPVEKSAVRKVVQLVRASKLRHIEGAMCHRNSFIEKIPPLNRTVPGDSNGFQANTDRVAAVIARAGGQVAVLELSKPGRLDTDAVPALQNGAEVMDLLFDPFDTCRLVTACDDSRIRVWQVPEGGLSETLTEPQAFLTGHRDKANVLAFHPLARSVLATAGYDSVLNVWNMDTQQAVLSLPLKEMLFAMAWSPCGRFLLTFSKEGQLSIYEPRSSEDPVQEGRGPDGRRGGRVLWLDNDHILVSGFSKTSTRTLSVYLSSDLSHPCSVVSLNVSPATLMLTFDPDTKLLYASGKGDSSVLVYEYVSDKHPYLFEVSPFSCPSSHQAVVFLPKVTCDVRKVEIGHGVRLTSSTVEQFVIRVPRTRLEYFQDDLYPPTPVTWEPVMTAQEWFQGGQGRAQATVDLQPADMKPLTEAPAPKQAPRKYESYNPQFKTDQEKKEELMSAMIERMGDKDDNPLPQSVAEGCDSDEWSD